MKRIKLHTSLAGPDGCLAPGEHEVSDELAKALVEAGSAKILEDEPEPVPEKKPEPEKELETADDKQEKREEAVQPRARRGRRRGGR